jgi:transposase
MGADNESEAIYRGTDHRGAEGGRGRSEDEGSLPLMIHGARSVIVRAKAKPGFADSWLGRLLARRHKNIVACALANRSARVVWALLAHDRHYWAAYSTAQAE